MTGPSASAQTVREVCALVPYQLGFVPTESLVLIALRDGRSGMVARADLADLVDAGGGAQAADMLAAALVREGAADALAVIYTARPVMPGGTMDGWGLDACEAMVAAAGNDVRVHPLAVVGSQTYHQLDPDGRVGPACDVGDLESTVAAATMVAAGRTIAAARDELASLPSVDEQSIRDATEAAAHLDTSAHGWQERELELWREALSGRATGTPALWGRLGEGIEDVELRDQVLTAIVEHASGPLEPQANELVEGLAIARIADPECAVSPNEVALGSAVGLLRQVAAHRSAGSAPALTLAAVGSWWAGDGAAAGVLNEAALRVEPPYRLAALLQTAIDVGMPPGWVRAQQLYPLPTRVIAAPRIEPSGPTGYGSPDQHQGPSL